MLAAEASVSIVRTAETEKRRRSARPRTRAKVWPPGSSATACVAAAAANRVSATPGQDLLDRAERLVDCGVGVGVGGGVRVGDRDEAERSARPLAGRLAVL